MGEKIDKIRIFVVEKRFFLELYKINIEKKRKKWWKSFFE